MKRFNGDTGLIQCLTHKPVVVVLRRQCHNHVETGSPNLIQNCMEYSIGGVITVVETQCSQIQALQTVQARSFSIPCHSWQNQMNRYPSKAGILK